MGIRNGKGGGGGKLCAKGEEGEGGGGKQVGSVNSISLRIRRILRTNIGCTVCEEMTTLIECWRSRRELRRNSDDFVDTAGKFVWPFNQAT